MWILWTQPPQLIAYVLLIDTAAVLVTVIQATRASIHVLDVVVLLALAGMGILQAELGRQVERIRRRVHETPHINMTSVWTFAGVLLLPPVLVVALVAILYLHLAVRSWYRLRDVPAFRSVFNAGLVVLTCTVAAVVLDQTGVHDMYGALGAGWESTGAIVASAAAYFVFGAVVVIPALSTRSGTWRELLGTWTDNVLELATLCLGMLAALAMATMPSLALAVMPPLLLLHRGVLVKQLEIAATTDEKTGLFNTAGWHRLATAELTRAKGTAHARLGVLMIDLDHFKRINDTYGHLAGDVVLTAVAGAITSAVRRYDSVGRFGGEEFVVLLPDITDSDIRTAAERIRTAIAQLRVDILGSGGDVCVVSGLSGSIGAATYPEAGSAVERLLEAADTALYRAKATGRNRVVSIVDVA